MTDAVRHQPFLIGGDKCGKTRGGEVNHVGPDDVCQILQDDLQNNPNWVSAVDNEFANEDCEDVCLRFANV